MRNKILLLLGTMLAGAFYAHAQTPICGFDQLTKQLKKDPEYVKQLEATESKIGHQVDMINQQRAMYQNLNVIAGPIYEIPVVVHVIYKTGDAIPGSTSNPSDAQINNAITALNNSFAAAPGSLNANGVATPIKFTLAKRKFDCSSTNGIERIDGSSVAGYGANGISYPDSGVPGADADAIKSLSIWPVREYYNIWVVWKISATTSGNSYVAGYANLPISGNNFSLSLKDGMVIMGLHMSPTSTVLTHEMGHAMGLYHTFEDGDETTCPTNANCNTDGDKVCDTDPVKNLLFVNPCALNSDPNSCNGGNPYNNSQKNIMGYGGCLDRLTLGQSTRMIAALNAARSGQMTSLGSVAPPITLIKAALQVPVNIVYNTTKTNMGPCNVSLVNMHYTSRGYNNDENRYYIDNSCNIGTTLSSSSAQTLTVTTETNPQRCKAWIDFNNDGQFDASEIVLDHTGSTATETHTGTITTAQLQGAKKNLLLRLRVMADWYNSPNFDYSTQLQYGQTEDFWVAIDASLPVTFAELSARLSNNHLAINWNTASETNNDHFLVQGSLDGETFITLAQYKSKAENGNSDSALSYKITISNEVATPIVYGMGVFAIMASLFSIRNRKRNVLIMSAIVAGSFFACHKYESQVATNSKNNIQFIRIAQVDKDGSATYSKVIKVMAE